MSSFLNNTMRTNRISVAGGMVFKHLFTDTQPNATFIFNRGETDLFVSRKFNVNSSNEYDIKIPPKTQISLVKVIGYKELYFYTDNDCVVDLESFEVSDLKPSDIPEAQSVVFINNQAITLGSIQSIIDNINVDLVSSLPSGTNNIGDVDILSLPPLPIGTNNIGKVDINSLPNTTYKAEKITLVAGIDYTVKNSGGYVSNIKTSLTDVLIKNNSVEVWKNEGNFSEGIFMDTNIVLNSVAGGIVYIVYK
jgi:hypothetical protein